jgi:hypothetical protein
LVIERRSTRTRTPSHDPADLTEKARTADRLEAAKWLADRGFGRSFNGVDAVSVTLVSATEVHAIVPTGATTGPITVTTPYGTVTSTIVFVVS